MLLLLLATTAQAVDPDTAPVSTKVKAGDWIQAEVDSWLIPEASARRCLALESELAIALRGLDDCVVEGQTALQAAQADLQLCRQRMDTDGAELGRCQGAEAGLLVDVDRLKRQRNTAYVVSGVLFTGVVGGVYLATQL